jgi:FkbM family methyltransferase
MFLFKLEKLRQILCELYFIQALLKGAAAGIEHRLVLQQMEFDFIVDVGANRGQFALVARKVFPRARILSFEPLAEPIQIFKRVFEHDRYITLYPYAIGGEKMSLTIHVTQDDDSSSILPITRFQSDLFPGSAEKETRQVMVYPLSQFIDAGSIPSASLLKVDVQGYELNVLQGCEDILQKFSHLYIECSFIELYENQALAHEIIAWLEARNFVLSSIHNLYYGKDGMTIQGDFLFSRKLDAEHHNPDLDGTLLHSEPIFLH